MIKRRRVAFLIESVLKESYSAEDVKNVIWNSFETKIDAVNIIDHRDGHYKFEVTPRTDDQDPLTVDDMNRILGDMHDSQLFDIEVKGSKIFISYDDKQFDESDQ